MKNVGGEYEIENWRKIGFWIFSLRPDVNPNGILKHFLKNLHVPKPTKFVRVTVLDD